MSDTPATPPPATPPPATPGASTTASETTGDATPEAPTKADPTKVDRNRYIAVLIVGPLLVLGFATLELQFGRPLAAVGASAAAILALVSALSVGIERVLEGFWTLVDTLSSNPKNIFYVDAKALETFAKHFDAVVRPPLEKARTALATVDAGAVKVKADKPKVQAKVDDLLTQVNAVMANQQSPKAWPALGDLQAGLQGVSNMLNSGKVQTDLQAAVTGVDALSNLGSSLAQNPGRKLLSLLAGSVMGLGATWVLGLDAIHAALGTKPLSFVLGSPATWPWGMVFTGLVVGLGSNPTHELIGALQAYKQNAQGSSPATATTAP